MWMWVIKRVPNQRWSTNWTRHGRPPFQSSSIADVQLPASLQASGAPSQLNPAQLGVRHKPLGLLSFFEPLEALSVVAYCLLKALAMRLSACCCMWAPCDERSGTESCSFWHGLPEDSQLLSRPVHCFSLARGAARQRRASRRRIGQELPIASVDEDEGAKKHDVPVHGLHWSPSSGCQEKSRTKWLPNPSPHAGTVATRLQVLNLTAPVAESLVPIQCDQKPLQDAEQMQLSRLLAVPPMPSVAAEDARVVHPEVTGTVGDRDTDGVAFATGAIATAALPDALALALRWGRCLWNFLGGGCSSGPWWFLCSWRLCLWGGPLGLRFRRSRRPCHSPHRWSHPRLALCAAICNRMLFAPSANSRRRTLFAPSASSHRRASFALSTRMTSSQIRSPLAPCSVRRRPFILNVRSIWNPHPAPRTWLSEPRRWLWRRTWPSLRRVPGESSWWRKVNGAAKTTIIWRYLRGPPRVSPRAPGCLGRDLEPSRLPLIQSRTARRPWKSRKRERTGLQGP